MSSNSNQIRMRTNVFVIADIQNEISSLGSADSASLECRYTVFLISAKYWIKAFSRVGVKDYGIPRKI